MSLLLFLWCLPQNITGLLVRIVTRARKMGNHYEYTIRLGSISLGEYIFLAPAHWNNERILAHEMGHQKQSKLLGWLYLPVVAIPSIIWAGCFKNYRKKHNINYYDFYTEKWADKLGGVDE